MHMAKTRPSPQKKIERREGGEEERGVVEKRREVRKPGKVERRER